MSVTKDKKTGKWMSQLRVKDWKGEEHHKKKRGFNTKKEALEWEKEFLNQATGSLGMTFKDFIELYMKDMEKRLKPGTVANKKFLIDQKITPFFGKIPLNDIKPTDIRKWQNELTSYRDEKGNPYSATYLKTINNQITAIFNYAVKYYGLKENPCHKAGGMGKKNAEEMDFWTRDEFNTFIKYFEDKPKYYAMFMTLYYTGIREGEMLALTPADIDLEKATIRINKNYQNVNGEELITSPKTPKSKRIVKLQAAAGPHSTTDDGTIRAIAVVVIELHLGILIQATETQREVALLGQLEVVEVQRITGTHPAADGGVFLNGTHHLGGLRLDVIIGNGACLINITAHREFVGSGLAPHRADADILLLPTIEAQTADTADG